MIKLRVMVVVADPDIRDLICVAVARDPLFVAHGCASAQEALVNAREWRPDIALLGEWLSDMAVAALLARLRADKRTAPIRVVVMTAGTLAGQDYEALGAIGAIAAPFDPAALAAMLRRFIPFAGNASPMRVDFLKRLERDARALSVCRRGLSRSYSEGTVRQVNRIAHALAGAGGIYGYAGVTCEAASLSEAALRNLAGEGQSVDVRRALDRLIARLTVT